MINNEVWYIYKQRGLTINDRAYVDLSLASVNIELTVLGLMIA